MKCKSRFSDCQIPYLREEELSAMEKTFHNSSTEPLVCKTLRGENRSFIISFSMYYRVYLVLMTL